MGGSSRSKLRNHHHHSTTSSIRSNGEATKSSSLLNSPSTSLREDDDDDVDAGRNKVGAVEDALNGTALYVSWNHIGSLFSVVFASILCSILLGVLVSITVSVHYQQDMFTKPMILQIRESSPSGNNRDFRNIRDDTLGELHSRFRPTVTTTTTTSSDQMEAADATMQLLRPPIVMLLSAQEYQKPALHFTRMDATIAVANHRPKSVADGRLYEIHTLPTGRQAVLMVVSEVKEYRLQLNRTEEERRQAEQYDRLRQSANQNHWNRVMNATTITDDDDVDATARTTTTNLQHLHYPPFIEPPRMDFEQWTRVHPTLCPDGKTVGYDSWKTLQAAVREANLFAAERFGTWNEYLALSESTFTGTFDDESYYYEQPITLRICPGVTLKARKGPIFINAENLHIRCDGCRVHVGGTHFSFGPQARNILIRGIEFRNAATSSLVFYHDGAIASFEDCRWIDNSAISNKVGNVVDVNSTSMVFFRRCTVGKRKNAPTGFVSSLSIRSK